MSRTTLLLLLAFLLGALCILPAAADLPSSYDMRDLNLTPVITDQGHYGVCWAFASISSLESSMIKQDPEKYTGIDLSPFQIIYFTYNRDELIDPASPYPGLEGIAGDYTNVDETNPQDNIYGLTLGGYTDQVVYSLAAGFGAVNESAAPFDSYGNNTAPSLDTAISMDEIVLDSAVSIPSSEEEDIKTMILENGAPAISFFITGDEPYLKELENGEWVYSLGDTDRESLESGSGHTVIIIGWDDAFSKEQFNVTPDHDGAWLIQNSWGSDLSNGTYIWMPYDEVTNPVTFFIGTEPWFDHNYQYDGGTLPADKPVNQTSATVGNVFTAGGDERIMAVSLDTDQSVNYTVSLYTDPVPGNPDSGLLLSEQEGTIEFPGYYTIRLDEPVPIEKGQNFSVVYDFEEDGPLNISIDTSTVADEDISTTTFARAGQSYLRTETGEWEDLSADGETNLRIKAFTTDMVFSIAVDPVSVSIEERGVSISGTTNFAPGREITVTLVCPNGENLRQQAVVTKGVTENTWEARFSPVKLVEDDYFVTAVRKGVGAESGFVPGGFADLLVLRAEPTSVPVKSVV